MVRFLKTKNDINFDVFTIEKGHNNMTYRNIPLRKCPFDYVIYQMILFEVEPDLIIEIGTDNGGTSLYLADLLDHLGNGVIHTIDIKDGLDEFVRKHKRIESFHNGWQNYDIKNADEFNKILIIEDSTHYYKDTLDILKLFSSLVSLNSYFIIEDGIINKLGLTRKYDGGPIRAINEFLQQTDNFTIDKKWCDFFGKNATFNINGYLKRIK
jgi:cephalosporin hydroxylase